jgi:hypothetical protein
MPAPYTALVYCTPTWHATVEQWLEDRRKVTQCPVIDGADARFPAPGFVPCNPEALRQSAEKKLKGWGIADSLSIDEYSLARNLASEYSKATAEMKVAVAEAAVNDSRRKGLSITQYVLKNRHGIKLYGRQRQGREVGTALDPNVGDVRVAKFVLQGKSGNFARGATLYLDPSGMGDRLVPVLENWMRQNVWVGHLPNVPLGRLFMLRHVGSKTAAKYQAINRQGLSDLRIQRIVEAPPPCPTPGEEWGKIALIAGVSTLAAMGIAYAAGEMWPGIKTWKG